MKKIIQIIISFILGVCVSAAAVWVLSVKRNPDISNQFDSETRKAIQEKHITKTVDIQAHNLAFVFDPQTVINIADLAGEIVPVKENIPVNMDSPSSFEISIAYAILSLNSELSLKLIKEQSFPDDSSGIRLQKMSYIVYNGKPAVQLSGKVRVVEWTYFSMIALLKADSSAEKIIIEPVKISPFRSAKILRVMSKTGLTIEKFIHPVKGSPLVIERNVMTLFPFRMFPKPNINGLIRKINCESGKIILTLGDLPQKITTYPGNWIQLKGGIVSFGDLTMRGGTVLLHDSDPADYFAFSMTEYSRMISAHGLFRMRPDGSLDGIVGDYK